MIEMDAEMMPSEMAGLVGKFDYVYHMASPASPVKYQSDPMRTIHANVGGLFACLQMVSPRGTVFFASSSEVYGDPLVSPQPESYKGSVSCTGPRACYDESKRLGETICTEWKRQTHNQVKIARLFNVYGPGTLPDDGRCMSNFIWRAMNERPVIVYGNGTQTRAFTYVDDVVRAIIDLAENTAAEFVGPVNIGSDIETSVLSIATAVLQEVDLWWPRDRPYRILHPVFGPPVVDDPTQRLPDLALAERVLGWRPAGLIPYGGSRGGIRRTIEHFEQEYMYDEADGRGEGGEAGAGAEARAEGPEDDEGQVPQG